LNISRRSIKVTAAIAATVVILASSAYAASATTKNSTVKPIILYAAMGYDSVIAKAFTAASGIPVKLVDDSTGPLLTKIAAEKNNPQWTALWVDGNTAFAALDKQGQLLAYKSKVKLNLVGTKLTPADHSYTPTGTTVMAALIYNSAKVTSVPTSYNDLLKPVYKGQVGMNDPSQSGPTFPFIAGLMNQRGGTSRGVAVGESFFTKLKANGLQVFPTNGDTKHALETGQINYGLIQSSAAEGEVMDFTAKPVAGFVPKVVYLSKSTLLPSVFGIDKGASAIQQTEAKKLIDYILSPAGQKIAESGDSSGDSLYWPVVPGVTALKGLSTFPKNYQTLDPYFWGPLQGKVVTWFDNKIK
jgi:iron(III) transport system substrate-binding protein